MSRTPFICRMAGCCGRILRTIQIRTMEASAPPIRIIAPGAAYRRDEVDATHLAQFNQMEGLYVDEGVSLADLRGTLEFFFRELFGKDAQFRFRPHFFPFTEPSFEVDIKATALGGADRWLEIAGCGMVDPAVFEAINAKRGDARLRSGEIHRLRVWLRPRSAGDDHVRHAGYPRLHRKRSALPRAVLAFSSHESLS